MPRRSPTIVGIAVETIVLSRLARNIPDIAAIIVTTMRLRERRAAYAVRTGGSWVVVAISRPSSSRNRQGLGDEARERLDAIVHGAVVATQVLHEQAPQERRDDVGRDVD